MTPPTISTTPIDLEPRQALAEQEERGDRGDRRELAPSTAAIGDALARAPAPKHRTEDLAGPGDDDQRQRGRVTVSRRWSDERAATTTTTPTSRAASATQATGTTRGLAGRDEPDPEDERGDRSRGSADAVAVSRRGRCVASVVSRVVGVGVAAVGRRRFVERVGDDVEVAGRRRPAGRLERRQHDADGDDAEHHRRAERRAGRRGRPR